MEIEALLKKIEQMTPQFGRAASDLSALVSRGRAGDYKGVLQNSRLVVEMLLRSIVATELKQTPGKAMLDELITKFRQSQNAGVIPTNVLAHMGTVQAWGNLSAHDHAGSLQDEGVRVGLEEAVTALNSMVAILSWYAAKYPNPSAAPQPTPAAGSEPAVKQLEVPRAASAAVSAPGHKRSSALPIAVGAVVLVVGAGAYVATRGPAVEDSLRKLDEVHAAAGDPAPPASCRPTDGKQAAALVEAAARLWGDGPAAPDAIEKLGEPGSAEHWYLLARAREKAGKDYEEAALNAARCTGFAAAEHLAGTAAFKSKRLDDAEARFQKAIQHAPAFARAYKNLGIVKVQKAQLNDAISLLTEATRRDPNDGDAHYSLGVIHTMLAGAAREKAQEELARSESRAANEAFCRAAKLGNATAKTKCAE